MKIGNTKIIIHRKEPTRLALLNLYDVCNKVFKTDSNFYSKDEVKALKRKPQNIFIQ